MYYVYIHKSQKNGTHYTGSTGDLDKRLERHSKGIVKATRYVRPLVMAYSETFDSAREGRKREVFLKKQKSRKYIEDLD